MVTIRNVDVGTLRVNASTGGVIGGDTDLLREIRDSLRSDASDPTVVQTIIQENRRLLLAIQGLSNQLGGVPGGSGPPIGGPRPPGIGGANQPQDIPENVKETLNRLERAVVTLTESGSERGHGGTDYFSREVQLTGIRTINDFFATLKLVDKEAEQSTRIFGSLGNLIQRQILANFENLAFGLQRLVLNTVNLGGAFREFHHNLNQQLVGMRESGVFGANILTPAQFFLQSITRLREGILTTSDSFQTAIHTVKEALQNNLLSPLMATGKSAAELASDFHEARADLRGGGMDSRAFLSTREANAHLASLVDQNLKFGIQSQLRDSNTLTMMSQDTNYLKVIASMTGETVGKLQEQLRASRQEQDILIGLGRLNQQEFNSFTESQKYLTALGPHGKNIADQASQFLSHGRTIGEQVANNPDYAKLASIPGYLDNMTRLLDIMTSGGTNDQMRRAVAAFGSRGSGGDFQSMNAVAQNQVFGAQRDAIAHTVLGGNIAGALGTPTAAQAGAAKDSQVMATIQRFTEYWQEQISPFFTLERSMLSLVAAIGVNTTALLFAASRISTLGGPGAGLMGSLMGGAGRVLGMAGGAAVGGLGAYGLGANSGGTMGASIGGAGGALLGSFIAPGIGTAIGMAAGSVIGGFIGQQFGETAVKTPNNVAGAESGVSGYDQDAGEMAGANMTAQLIPITREQNTILYELLSETRSQTRMISGGGREPARPAGAGFGSGQPSRSMLNRPDDSTPYVGP